MKKVLLAVAVFVMLAGVACAETSAEIQAKLNAMQQPFATLQQEQRAVSAEMQNMRNEFASLMAQLKEAQDREAKEAAEKDKKKEKK